MHNIIIYYYIIHIIYMYTIGVAHFFANYD